MFQVIPIRDTSENIDAIHEVAKLEGMPAAALLRKIARAYCIKAGYKIDEGEIKRGFQDGQPTKGKKKGKRK